VTNVVLCLSHSIEEHDQLRLLHGIGANVFSIGGYINPSSPHDPKRDALRQIPHYPDLQAAVDAIGAPDNLGAAQRRIPDAILDWADVIVFHHYLDRLFGQWDRIRAWLDGGSHRRVIWRSVGQSVTGNELDAAPFMRDGLERVLYSPKERNIPGFSGGDSPVIRFYKDPDEWTGWTGEEARVINITQHLAQREPYTNHGFWEAATRGLPRMALGPGSEVLGGPGQLTLDEMKHWLRTSRAYLYTGTQPASYTLGLIEAMMTGTPVVSIGPAWMRIFPFGPGLFEGHELAGPHRGGDMNSSDNARKALRILLDDEMIAADESEFTRAHAIELFGMDTIADQWARYLGVGVAA
jgi:hypothetical protein